MSQFDWSYCSISPHVVNVFTSRIIRHLSTGETLLGRPLLCLRLSENAVPSGLRACLYTFALLMWGNLFRRFSPRILCTWYSILISADVFGWTFWYFMICLVCVCNERENLVVFMLRRKNYSFVYTFQKWDRNFSLKSVSEWCLCLGFNSYAFNSVVFMLWRKNYLFVYTFQKWERNFSLKSVQNVYLQIWTYWLCICLLYLVLCHKKLAPLLNAIKCIILSFYSLWALSELFKYIQKWNQSIFDIEKYPTD